MGAEASDCWRVASDASIAWREWDGEYVVYVGCRADTHLLTSAAGAVLRSLLECDSPLGLQAIFDRSFGDRTSVAADMSPAECEALAAMLSNFERLGILSRRAA